MPDETTATKRRATYTPIAGGALSLLVFTAAGWMLRGASQEQQASEVPVAHAPTQVPTKLAPGRLVFVAYCARCHGPEGHGDGPDASSLRSRPRDLTTASWRTPLHSDSVRKVISEGLPGTMMVGLGGALSPRELDAVTDYAMSLAPKDPNRANALEATLRTAGFVPSSRSSRAPALEVRDKDGGSVTLDALRGKPVLIVFWGTSCAPCMKELPELGQFRAKFRAAELGVLAICADETDAAVVRSVADRRVPGLPVHVDPTGAVRIAYDVQALPFAVLVGPGGDLLGTAQGSMRWASPEMEALIRSF